MAYDTSTFDPKAAAEARKAEMEEITSKLEKGVKDIFDGANYQQYLNFCAKLPRYSVNNQILIMMQKPDATMCQSFTNWKEVNRHVRKGEKGIRIPLYCLPGVGKGVACTLSLTVKNNPREFISQEDLLSCCRQTEQNVADKIARREELLPEEEELGHVGQTALDALSDYGALGSLPVSNQMDLFSFC